MTHSSVHGCSKSTGSSLHLCMTTKGKFKAGSDVAGHELRPVQLYVEHVSIVWFVRTWRRAGALLFHRSYLLKKFKKKKESKEPAFRVVNRRMLTDRAAHLHEAWLALIDRNYILLGWTFCLFFFFLLKKDCSRINFKHDLKIASCFQFWCPALRYIEMTSMTRS